MPLGAAIETEGRLRAQRDGRGSALRSENKPATPAEEKAHIEKVWRTPTRMSEAELSRRIEELLAE